MTKQGLFGLFAATVASVVLSLSACGSPNAQGQLVPDGGGGQLDGTVGARDAKSLDDGPKGLPGVDASTPLSTLSISPKTATLTITSSASPPTQAFTTTLASLGSSKTVTPAWTLSDYSVAAIDAAGKLTPTGTVAEKLTVTASYAGLTATATVTLIVSVTSSLGDVTLPDGTVITENASGISAANQTALNAAPTGASASASPLVYPYDGTVFPLGLVAPVAQFVPGAVVPVDFKVSLDTTNFHWDGFGHVGDPTRLQAAIPQSIWDGALQSTTPNSTSPGLTLSLVTATGGVAYGPSKSHLIVAPGKLTGVIYYESYSSDPLPGATDGSTDFGLWAVKPGLTTPPSHLQPGCVLCHSVSASGNTLTASTDDQNGATTGANTGVFRIESDGGYTHLATSPTALPYTENSARGLGWATVSPDGKVVMRSETQYWGGDALLAWAVPSEPLMANGQLQPLSTSMTVTGNLDMFVPEYSADGKHLVYVTAQGGVEAGVPGTPSQSIGILDIAATVTDGGADASNFGTVSLTNAHTIYDSTKASDPDAGASAYTKVPTFLPDSQSIVFEETKQSSPDSNDMLPDYVDNSETVYVDGELAMLQPNGSGGYVRAPLANANKGYDPTAATHNFEPKPLPVPVGGYYWVVFSSTRADAYPGVSYPKKLWVTAISPGGTTGKDTSHPAFTLVNQAIVSGQKSQRAYWALAPCQASGSGCQSTSDCCAGSCIPQTGADAGSGLVCGTPSAEMCVPLGGRCDVGSNTCCEASQGIQCIGTLNGSGTCNVPAPPPP
jgi:hypothetical protein